MADPFLKRARAAYYLAWIPLTALVVLILGLGEMGLWQALAVSITMCGLYALVCGSTFYLARAWPIKRARLFQVLINLVAATALAGGAFAGLGYIISKLSAEYFDV